MRGKVVPAIRPPLITILSLALVRVAWPACTATKQNAFYGPSNGSSNTATVNATVNAVGDLVVFSAMCYSSNNLAACTPISLTMNGQTATRTTVAGSPAVQEAGGENGNNGQGWIYYIESAAASGSQAATFTVSGTHNDIQISYIDFSLSSGCRATHHLDSTLAGSAGISNTSPGATSGPSISDTGALLFNFTWTSGHINDPVIAPWSCPVYTGGTETCEFNNTVNAVGYLLSAPSGTITASWNVNQQSISWESLTAAFTLSVSTIQPNPPTSLTAIIH